MPRSSRPARFEFDAIALGDANGDAGGIEEALGGLGDPLQRMRGIAVGVGDRVEDFGAGVLPLGGGAQFVLEAKTDQRAGGLMLDRGVPLLDSRFQLPLELGNPLLEIGHGVLGKRGHFP